MLVLQNRVGVLDLCPLSTSQDFGLYVKTITVDNLALGLDLGLKRSTFTLGLGVRSTLVWILNGLGIGEA